MLAACLEVTKRMKGALGMNTGAASSAPTNVNSRLLVAPQRLFSAPNSGYSQARTLAATAWAESYMEIATRQSGVATIVDVTGDITLYNSPQVRKILIELLREKRVPRVVVNLLKVKYIDSAGVASLVEGLKISRELKNGFALYGLSPIAREVFELTRLIKVFEVYDNEEDAVRGPTGKSPSGATI
jgi:anti-sigma B factor antagonist